LATLCDDLLADATRFAGAFEDDLCLLGMEVARLGVVGDAGRDSLTGLFNPNYLNETLEREMHRAGRHGYHIGVIALEIAGLEHFAAQHGQRAADEVLREFGALLNRHTRRSDIACRPRATGFTLVLPESSLNNTQHKAAQLCELLRGQHPQLFDGGALSLALGLASFPHNGATGESVVRAATEAMGKAQTG
jgi:diguanylate cyclase (GGDEF)-like protein